MLRVVEESDTVFLSTNVSGAFKRQMQLGVLQ